MKRRLVVERYFLAGQYVAQGVKLYVPAQDFHKAIRVAGMIDVVCAVAAPAAVNTPTPVNRADTQHAPPFGSALGFGVRDSLARVVRDFFTALKRDGRKASPAVNRRLPDR